MDGWMDGWTNVSDISACSLQNLYVTNISLIVFVSFNQEYLILIFYINNLKKKFTLQKGGDIAQWENLHPFQAFSFRII